MPWRNPRDVLTVKVRYMGGAEAWIQIEARGSKGAWPGHVSLFDAFSEVWQWDRKPKTIQRPRDFDGAERA